MSSERVTRSQGPDNAFLLGLQQGITKMMVEAANAAIHEFLKISDKRIPQVSEANFVVNYTSKDYYWTSKDIFPCRPFPNRDNAATVRHFKNGVTTRTVTIVIPPITEWALEECNAVKAGLEFGKVRCIVRTDENPGYMVDVVANDAAAEFFDYVARGCGPS